MIQVLGAQLLPDFFYMMDNFVGGKNKKEIIDNVEAKNIRVYLQLGFSNQLI